MNDRMEVHIVRTIPAPCEAVFEAWLDPKRLAKFLLPAPAMATTVERLDARVGGGFALVMHAGQTRLPHHGEYLAIDRYRRLQFTWHSHATAPGSVVTLTFEALGENTTRMTLHHSGFPDAASCAAHDAGWTQILIALERMARAAG